MPHRAAVVLDLPFFLVAEELTKVAGQSRVLFNVIFVILEIVWVFCIVLLLRLIYIFTSGRQASNSLNQNR